MISPKLNQAINEQMNFEFYSAHIYLSMAAYCAASDLPGFSHFLRVQYREEVDHAMKFFNFVAEMEGNVKITGFQDPQSDFSSVLNAFEIALNHEKIVALVYFPVPQFHLILLSTFGTSFACILWVYKHNLFAFVLCLVLYVAYQQSNL